MAQAKSINTTNPFDIIPRLHALAVVADVSVATLDRNWPLWPAMLLAR
jgi:hypothetical protein